MSDPNTGSASSVFPGHLDAQVQCFTSSAPTAGNNFSKSPQDVLDWLPFNPVQNWSASNHDGTTTLQVHDPTSWFPTDDGRVVFYGYKPQDSRPPLTYMALHQQIQLCPPYHHHGEQRVVVVGVLLPPCKMAETAVVLVSILSQARGYHSSITVAPLDPHTTTDKLVAALAQLQCTALVTTADLWQQHALDSAIPQQQLVHVHLIHPSDVAVGAVTWQCIRSSADQAVTKTTSGTGTTTADDDPPVLLLRTSGTTALPKIVPLTRTNLLYNALCLASSLKLQRVDVGCNVMPMYHIGGIACALLSVLVSGSSIVMMPGGPFDATAFLDCLTRSSSSTPTWYYAAPSMHKALILTAQARLRALAVPGCAVPTSLPNRLRFVRSGAAYLSPDTAYNLSRVLDCPVISTYSMSECMPVCSAHSSPVVYKYSNAAATAVGVLHDQELAVGPPIGCSLCIVDKSGNPLQYGKVGEVVLRGIGVLQAYPSVPKRESHTADGWFRTGDVGKLDPKTGSLTLTGRIKEVIKRGGEQVWPNEIDKVVEQVPGVAVAVTFGVPNPLWGEEVAVAVVPIASQQANTNPNSLSTTQNVLKDKILVACRSKLDAAAVPSQIVVVESTESLLKGSTGKYLRTKMAQHLYVQPTDVAALRALERMAMHPAPPYNVVEVSAVTPSSALNGLRFLVACFVVQMHVGLYPNIGWLKVQSFSFNMQIFFMLGAFQLACSTRSSQLNWSQFVGTKIGAMHALFVVVQFLALPSFLLFMCGPDGYQETFEDERCTEGLTGLLVSFVTKTATGLFPIDQSNPPSWFQGAFYSFLIIFPWLNARLRAAPASRLSWIFVISLLVATFIMVLLFAVGFYGLNYTFISWLPALVSGIIAGYIFARSHHPIQPGTTTSTPDGTKRPWYQNPVVWGWVTDGLSLIFLMLEIVVIFSPNCLYIRAETFEEMRPGQELPDNDDDDGDYVHVCSITYHEFVDFIHADEQDSDNMGRWGTELGGILGFARIATPLVLLWLYGMAYGRGVTARIMNTCVLQRLSHLAYPLYLLHVPIGRYYWYFTRGPEAEHWWEDAAGFPIPLDWYEAIVVILIGLVLGHALDRFVIQHLSKYTVIWGVATCNLIVRCFSCCGCAPPKDAMEEQSEGGAQTSSNLHKVQQLVQDLTGSQKIDQTTDLKDLGLDSLGATALLGILKANIHAAKSLTMANLVAMTTVGDLVEFLNHTTQDDVAPAPIAADV